MRFRPDDFSPEAIEAARMRAVQYRIDMLSEQEPLVIGKRPYHQQLTTNSAAFFVFALWRCSAP
eukprot:5968266-Alexandrium_andersonii.AAC.1